MIKKTIICVVLLTLLLSINSINAFAHDREEHDKGLESVLFLDSWNKRSQSKEQREALLAIECASYLAIDQMNSKGEKELEFLEDYGVRDLPKGINAINIKASGHNHREYTHMGWDTEELKDPDNWLIRKGILLNTTDKVFGFKPSLIRKKHDEKCNSFCALVYYVHLIEDHRADNHYQNGKQQMELAYIDSGREGIIDELIRHCKILFKDQDNSRVYSHLIMKLKSLNKRTKRIVRKLNRTNGQKGYKKYSAYAEDLEETLEIYVPKLLAKEKFFKKVFY